MCIMPFSSESGASIEPLLNDIDSSGHAYLLDKEANRATLIAQARALIDVLETPNEKVLWLAWAEPTRHAAIRTALALNLFLHLSTPKTASQLAVICGASPALLQRLLRHLAATFVITEVAPGTYESTALSRLLTDPRHYSAITYNAALNNQVLARLPAYLASTGYVEPRDPLHGPFQFAFDTKLAPWE